MPPTWLVVTSHLVFNRVSRYLLAAFGSRSWIVGYLNARLFRISSLWISFPFSISFGELIVDSDTIVSFFFLSLSLSSGVITSFECPRNSSTTINSLADKITTVVSFESRDSSKPGPGHSVHSQRDALMFRILQLPRNTIDRGIVGSPCV